MSEVVFDDIATALREAALIAKGEADPTTYRVHVPVEVDVRAIRHRIGLTQQSFAAAFGFPIQTLRDWEQRCHNACERLERPC